MLAEDEDIRTVQKFLDVMRRANDKDIPSRAERAVSTLVELVNELWIDRAQTIKYLGVRRQTLFLWERKGKLRRVPVRGRRIFYLRADIEAIKNDLMAE